MFSGYNKNNAQGTLVGNWVEEEALRSATGYSRRKVPLARDAPEPTHDRVLRHAHATPDHPAYETTLQASTRYGDGVVKPGVGPRAARRDADALHQAALAQQELLPPSSSSTTTTTTKSSFPAPDPATLLAVTRVPRGRNGSRVVDAAVQHLTRAELADHDRATLDALRLASPAITRYSYAVATGTGLDFPSTAEATTNNNNPFARSSAFSNDLRDATKRHAEAMEPASAHDEPLGRTLHQRSALDRLARALAEDAHLVAALHAAAPLGVLDLAAFRQLAASVLGDRDAIHAFMGLDAEQIGAVPLAAVLQLAGH